MNIIQTVKKSILPSGSVLRMSFSIEGIYYIFLEKEIWIEDNSDTWKHYGGYNKHQKEMVWNGNILKDANYYFEDFKTNPLIDN